MKVTVEDLSNSMINIELGLSPDEIDLLISRLAMLKREPDQHFHVSSNFDGSCRVGDLSFYIKQPDDPDDILIFGKAVFPDDPIDFCNKA